MTPRYVIISPVRDEEQFLERTLDSVLQQTVSPVRWVLVDDGSVDRTPEILRRCQEKAPWISVIRRERSGGRQPGTGIIAAFNAGYEQLCRVDYDYIVKLDCDVVLPAGYFETLLAKFDEDRRLGIASGVYLENKNGEWNPIPMPDYHAAGASKVLRRACFEEIGGFVGVRGWDTVDEIKAQAKGWKTRHFPQIRFQHLKPEGSSSGWRRTQLMNGEAYYRYGGGKLFFLLKLLHSAVTTRPFVGAAAVMFWGYVKLYLSKEPKLVTPAEARVYRQMQYFRLLGRNPKSRGVSERGYASTAS